MIVPGNDQQSSADHYRFSRQGEAHLFRQEWECFYCQRLHRIQGSKIPRFIGICPLQISHFRLLIPPSECPTFNNRDLQEFGHSNSTAIQPVQDQTLGLVFRNTVPVVTRDNGLFQDIQGQFQVCYADLRWQVKAICSSFSSPMFPVSLEPTPFTCLILNKTLYGSTYLVTQRLVFCRHLITGVCR